MQEQINERTVALSVKGAKLTSHMLAKAMQAFLKKARQPRKINIKHGRQSVRSLTKQGASLANIEVSGDDIGSFKRTARKYNVDFAVDLFKLNIKTPIAKGRWNICYKHFHVNRQKTPRAMINGISYAIKKDKVISSLVFFA